MEKAGAAVGIIVDNTPYDDVEFIVMSDDGTGGGIQIPSMLIGKGDGDKLINFYKRASEDDLSKMVLIASFEMEKPDDRVEYDFWYTSSNDRALDFL